MASEMAPQLQRSAIEAIHQLRSRMLLKRDGCPVIDGVERCTKPTVASQGTTWIIVGVIVGIIVVGAFSVLTFLHIKNKRRNEREDLEDRFQMADYGLEPPTGSSKIPQVPGSGSRKLSLDDSLGTNGRPSEAMSQTKRASGLPRGYVNPFVSPADDSASIKSIDLNPKWPSRSDSPASSQSPLPSKNP